VHPIGGLIEDRLTTVADAQEKDFFAKVEPLIESLAGRYVVILTAREGRRIYVDPVSALGVVYDAKTRAVASSVLLAIDREHQPNPKFDNEGILAGLGNYSFQHTSDAHIKRLLPNHYLDLGDFSHIRHWPKSDQKFETAPQNIAQAIGEIGARMGKTIGDIANKKHTVMPISAGRDSRNLVACGRAHLGKVKEFFAFAHSYNGRLDAAVGSLVAERMGVGFNVYDPRDYPRGALHGVYRRKQATRNFHISNGFSGGAPREILTGLYRLQKAGSWHLRGNVMDLMQASHWKVGARNPNNHKPAHGIKRLLITGGDGFNDEMVKRWMPEYEEWYQGLGAIKAQPYDMIFNELYLAGSQGGKMYGMNHHFYISPFNDRYTIERAISLPLDFRIKDAANDQLLAGTAPELTSIPFLRTYQKLAADHGANWFGSTAVHMGKRKEKPKDFVLH
jgi:asparagine synthetase B (glutamine-hydrolysing)